MAPTITRVSLSYATPAVLSASIICPPDITIECDESTKPSNTGEATTESCDLDLKIDFWDQVEKGERCHEEKQITRRWELQNKDEFD